VSVIALGKSYPSIFARPVIKSVDSRIFSFRYFRDCMSCTFCKDQCCEHGVDIDAGNAEHVLGLGEAFEAYVGRPMAFWFTEEEGADSEFPSGRRRRTAVADGYCVFHDRIRRGCKIHAWSLAHGLDHRRLKPLVSLLFPVTFEAGVLMPSNEILDGTLICSGEGESLYAGARDEIAYFFGRELVVALDGLAAHTP